MWTSVNLRDRVAIGLLLVLESALPLEVHRRRRRRRSVESWIPCRPAPHWVTHIAASINLWRQLAGATSSMTQRIGSTWWWRHSSRYVTRKCPDIGTAGDRSCLYHFAHIGDLRAAVSGFLPPRTPAPLKLPYLPSPLRLILGVQLGFIRLAHNYSSRIATFWRQAVGRGDRERKCADTIGTVPVPWAGRFQCQNSKI